MNLCRACRQDFSSLAAFDRHRIGDHALDWHEHEHGRRCMDEEELAAAGMEVDGRGRWRIEVTDRERERLSALRGSALTASEGAA